MHKLFISIVVAFCISVPVDAKPIFEKETAMSTNLLISPRLKRLFAKTKLVCFGRYAMTVPQEAEVLWGPVSFPSKIAIFTGGMNAIQKVRDEDIATILRKNKSAEIVSSTNGPTAESWQVRYFANKFAKARGAIYFKTYVNKGDLSFVSGDGVQDDETTSDAAIARQIEFAKKVHLRDINEVPQEPGFCIDHGFIASNRYNDQEVTNAGIYLPSFPDITFSVTSNKDAYADYKPDTFKRNVFGLLERIQQAKDQGGLAYPNVKELRSGKRTINNWHGEESLVIRPDGVHDFEWALVGKPTDVANPSEFNMHLHSKVADNTVGAAKETELSDEEIVALWDALTGGFKFRVQVPGAPEGSYYITSTQPISPLPPVVWNSDQLCPKDGYYKLVVDDPAYPFQPSVQRRPPSPEKAGSTFDRYIISESEWMDKVHMIWVRDLDEDGLKYARKRS